jgi:hypothetical protein
MNGDASLTVNVLQAKLLCGTAYCGDMSSFQCVLRKLEISWKRRKPERCGLQDKPDQNIYGNNKVRMR